MLNENQRFLSCSISSVDFCTTLRERGNVAKQTNTFGHGCCVSEQEILGWIRTAYYCAATNRLAENNLMPQTDLLPLQPRQSLGACSVRVVRAILAAVGLPTGHRILECLLDRLCWIIYAVGDTPKMPSHKLRSNHSSGHQCSNRDGKSIK